MTRIEAPVLARLAFVAAFGLGLAGMHMGLSTATASGPGPAATVSVAAPAPHQGYGMASCAEGGTACSVEYCAAPAASALDGYAVPCEDASTKG